MLRMNAPQPPLVLHVIHHLHMGGMENGLVNLINHMPASKYRHAIACIDDYSDFRQRITRPDVEVIALHRSRVGIGKLRRDIFRLCRRLKPAIVHSRNQSGLDALLPSRLAGVAHRVHGEHGWDVHDLNGKKLKPVILRRLHAPLIDRYVTVSNDLAQYLVKRVGIGAARISHICNGVDTARFKPSPRKLRDWLPADFRGDDVMLFGTVARIQPVKDQATLLRAFAQLLDQQPALRQRLRLAIVGDGPLLAELRALAESLNIAAVTHFPGALNNVHEILPSLDVFVLPSLNEGISNTILEAMASGLPVIATAVGGNVELIEDGVCGRFFAPGDTAALADLLLAYAQSPQLRQTHSHAARQVAVARFSLDAMVASYQAVYDRLLQRK